MAGRSGWSRLTPAYRGRLERRGISRGAWESGADLRVARGHTPQRPRGAAPEPVTRAAVAGGRLDDAQQRILRAFRGPGWIPEGTSDDVRAALSQLRGQPSSWAGVRFVPAPRGEPWAMVVTPKGAVRRPDGTSAYDQVVLIPGGGGPGTAAREVLDLFTHPEAGGVPPKDPRWRGWTSESLDVAEPLGEASTGYGERSEVLVEIERLVAELDAEAAAG